MNKARLLTAAVIGMGVLIIIGLIALVIGIINKADQSGAGPNSTTANRKAAASTAGALRTDPVSLGLPAGTKVLRLSRARGGIAILVERPDGAQSVYIVPTHTKGAPLRIDITKPAPR